MAKVLIIGASRGVGLATVRAALRAGHSVRALARSVSSLRIQDAALEKVSGDALNRDTIRNAVADIDVIIQTLGVDFAPRVVFSGTTLFSESTRILVDAMKAAGVRRLITVTGLGAGDSRGHGGFLYDAALLLILKRVYDDKDVQEWIIKRSGLDWTIVRPGLLTDTSATGRYRVLTASKDWRAGTISRADVADFLVRQIDDHAFIGTTPLLIDPQSRFYFSTLGSAA
jgi:putative NADH-flavin reductase